MTSSRSARLVLPGLLGPVADADAVASLAPRLPALERVLARARALADGIADGEGSVCAAFGIDGPPWPVAALARLGEHDAGPAIDASGWWLRLDPVHLRVDANHARLFGPHALALSAHEAQALVARLNGHLADEGLRIEAPAPDRWYLRLAEAPALETWPLPVVAGRNVNPFMPGGAAAARWRARVTELQMLLHDAPENSAREAAGRLPANSVWPWGGGACPPAPQAPARILARDPLSHGLAGVAGAAAPAWPETVPEWAAGTTLVVDFTPREPLVHGEIDAWLEAVASMEQRWLQPALAALRAGRLQRLSLEPGDGRRFVLGRGGLLRLWRRGRAWHRWLAPEPSWG